MAFKAGTCRLAHNPAHTHVKWMMSPSRYKLSSAHLQEAERAGCGSGAPTDPAKSAPLAAALTLRRRRWKQCRLWPQRDCARQVCGERQPAERLCLPAPALPCRPLRGWWRLCRISVSVGLESWMYRQGGDRVQPIAACVNVTSAWLQCVYTSPALNMPSYQVHPIGLATIGAPQRVRQ